MNCKTALTDILVLFSILNAISFQNIRFLRSWNSIVKKVKRKKNPLTIIHDISKLSLKIKPKILAAPIPSGGGYAQAGGYAGRK